MGMIEELDIDSWIQNSILMLLVLLQIKNAVEIHCVNIYAHYILRIEKLLFKLFN